MLNRTLSTHGLKLLQQWEGFKNHVYLDSGNVPTIGVGHALTLSERKSGKIIIGDEVVKYADGLDGSQVTALLRQDLTPVEQLVDKRVIVPLTPYQFDALVSFAFNVGGAAFVGSTLLRSLNAKLYDRVPEQLKRWVHDGGKVVKGLVIRRDNEIRLWLGQL